MRNISLTVFLTAILIMLTGCSTELSLVSGPDSPAETTIATIEPVTEAPLPDISNLESADGIYVYDNIGVLNSEQISQLNNYCEKLYKERLINTAVVISDNIGEKSPYDYAEEMYTDIYQGRGSGLLLLINNDTRDDYLYRTGSCLKAIPDDDDDIAFFWSTKDLVAGNYSSAILRIMQLGEKCPQYVFDNIGIFSEEEIDSLEKKLTEKKNIFLLATSNGTDKTNEDICQSYYERRSKDHNGFMVMLDTKSNTVTIVSDEKMPDELSKARASAEKLMKSGDALAAVNEIVASIG